jgi:hypothetical protein
VASVPIAGISAETGIGIKRERYMIMSNAPFTALLNTINHERTFLTTIFLGSRRWLPITKAFRLRRMPSRVIDPFH